ncbi:YkgJ family cysteine cluster protein [Chloroflexota bacterium]
MSQNLKEELPEEYPKLSLKSKFGFSCNKELSCFTKCCRDVNIFLTPYDVMRMKNALNISSGEFLDKYTIPLVVKEQKLRVVLLKMEEENDNVCPFVSAEGCRIYEDRPWSCRIFPLMTTQPDAKEGDEEFDFIAGKSFPCLGAEQDKEWTVEKWLINQEVDIYNKMSQPYMEITMQECFLEGKGLSQAETEMLYMSCYDLDRFRRHIFESRFLQLFDIEDEVIEKIKTDDEALLGFSARWLKFSLFKENTIQIKGEIAEKKEGAG